MRAVSAIPGWKHWGHISTIGADLFSTESNASAQTPLPLIKFHFQVTKSHEKSRKVIFARFRNGIGLLFQLALQRIFLLTSPRSEVRAGPNTYQYMNGKSRGQISDG